MSCEAPPTQSKPATIAAERFWRTREADEHAQSVLCNIVKALVKMIPTFQKGAQSSLPYKRKFYAFHSWEPSINNFDLGFCAISCSNFVFQGRVLHHLLHRGKFSSSEPPPTLASKRFQFKDHDRTEQYGGIANDDESPKTEDQRE